MSDIINTELDVVTTTKVEKRYPITDAVAKAFFIDGFGTVALFSIPLIAPAVLPTFPVLTLYQIAGAAVINFAFSVPTYYLRSAAREEGHEYTGAMFGGAFKYGSRDIYKNGFMEGVEIKTALGGVNNLAYEACNNNDLCSNDVGVNIAFTMGVEGSEALILSAYQGGDIVHGVQSGLLGGLISAIGANYLYANSIDTIHQMVDHVYDI